VLPSVGPAVAEGVAPVTPDRIQEVPSTRVDPFPEFDNFAWRAFIALVASQWPTVTRPIDPQNDGVYFPGPAPPPDAPCENYQAIDTPKENLVDTTIETYFQDPPSSCMPCHQSVSNARGRDFVR
jgi:hypothetical protein